MKLNNRGFAISTIMYMILIMAIILITVTLTLLSNRKLILDKSKQEAKDTIYNTLPKKYQRVEYIEGTGTQYIDTGFKPNNDTRIDTKINVTQNLVGNISLYGARTTSSTDTFSMFVSISSGGSRFDYKTYINILAPTLTIGEHTIIQDKNKNYIDGTEYTIRDYTQFSCEYNLYLFAINNANAATLQTKNVQLKQCKIYNNTNLVRDFIPCYRKSDNEPGLYDIVNGVFYTNNGTGEFLVGPNL